MIKAKLPTLNEVIAANRRNKYNGNKFKKEIEELIGWYIKQAQVVGSLSKIEEPVDILIDFYERTAKRDVYNIQSSQKFIIDALVRNGILKNDGQRYVKNVYHRVMKGDTDHAIVTMYPAEQIKLTIEGEEI